MNTSKIVVRLDAERHTAELEMMAPHHNPRVEGLEHTLGQIGIRLLQTVELSTPRYRITHARLAERDGSEFDGARLMQILCAVRDPKGTHSVYRRCNAA